MFRLRRSGLRVAALVGAACVALSGCAASAVPASEVAAAWDKAANESAYAKKALVRVAERERLRKWDPCALHSPKAAEEVTGDQASEIAPSDLNECTLRMTSEWAFYLTTGVMWPPEDKEEVSAEKVGGTTLYRRRQDDDSCQYLMPVGNHFAVELMADTDADDGKKACERARSYVTKILPRWENPPLRSDKRTTPVIALATKNPCEVPLAQAQLGPAPNMARTGVHLSELYECSLQDVAKTGETQDRFTVEFKLAESTKDVSDGSETSVSGQFAIAVETDDIKCMVRTDFNPDVVVDGNSNTRANTVDTPVVTVTAGSCERAKSYMERVLKAARS